MTQTITIRGDGISLDLLLWRLHGVRGREIVAATLASNPGLAALGPILPHGTEVFVPDLPTRAEPAPRRIVSLFG